MTPTSAKVLAKAAFPEEDKVEGFFLLGTFRARGAFKRLFEHYKINKAQIRTLLEIVEERGKALEIAIAELEQCEPPDEYPEVQSAWADIMRETRETLAATEVRLAALILEET